MKKVILTAILLGTLLWAVEPWHQDYDPILWWYQNMLPLDTLNRTFKVNDTLIWVAGENGLVYKYTGSENHRSCTSIEISNMQNCQFTDIFFIDEMHGWLTGKQKETGYHSIIVCKTIDGGNKWVILPLLLPQATNLFYLKIRFANRYNGYILGDDGTVFKTHDGGITWSRSRVPDY